MKGWCDGMKNLLLKEMKLSASILSYLFLAFSLMTMIPGYPILLSAFFICFGLFHSFQTGRENNDILYSALLPIKKKDAVLAKYLFVCFIQMTGLVLMLVLTLIRMNVLGQAVVYTENPMMNANPFYLFGILLIFSLFDLGFIPGFFKTAYNFGKPFIFFILETMIVIGLFETLHHIPGLSMLNNTTGEGLWLWFILGLLIYAISVLAGIKLSQKRFDLVDL